MSIVYEAMMTFFCRLIPPKGFFLEEVPQIKSVTQSLGNAIVSYETYIKNMKLAHRFGYSFLINIINLILSSIFFASKYLIMIMAIIASF